MIDGYWKKKKGYLISAPALPMKREIFWRTKRSELKVESISLGMPIMTWIPVPMRARSASGFASKSFTLVILFALRRSTTVDGLIL